jgi:hypothetical protein
MKKSNYEKFKALDPFFNIVMMISATTRGFETPAVNQRNRFAR